MQRSEIQERHSPTRLPAIMFIQCEANWPVKFSWRNLPAGRLCEAQYSVRTNDVVSIIYFPTATLHSVLYDATILTNIELQ